MLVRWWAGAGFVSLGVRVSPCTGGTLATCWGRGLWRLQSFSLEVRPPFSVPAALPVGGTLFMYIVVVA